MATPTRQLHPNLAQADGSRARCSVHPAAVAREVARISANPAGTEEATEFQGKRRSRAWPTKRRCRREDWQRRRAPARPQLRFLRRQPNWHLSARKVVGARGQTVFPARQAPQKGGIWQNQCRIFLEMHNALSCEAHSAVWLSAWTLAKVEGEMPGLPLGKAPERRAGRLAREREEQGKEPPTARKAPCETRSSIRARSEVSLRSSAGPLFGSQRSAPKEPQHE